jgi:RNA polymerase sigma factor (sigma-70 family)
VAEDILTLIHRVRANTNDPDAWKEFDQRYRGRVRRVLNAFSQLTSAEREDLEQDVFVSLLDGGLENLNSTTEGQINRYVVRITQNKAISLLRRHGRRFEVPYPTLLEDGEDSGETLEPPSNDPKDDPHQNILDKEQAEHLRVCLEKLSLIDQQVFWLRVKERPYEEIAKQLKLPQGTVAKKQFSAKKHIERCLRELGLL